MAKSRTSKLSKTAVEFVTWERVCRVATAGRAGVPHLVPVCHVFAAGKLYFGSGRGRKVRNIRENPRVTITVDAYSEHWAGLKGVMIQGRARLFERGAGFKRGRDLLYRKFPQYRREAALSPSDSVVVEVTPTRVFEWGLK